MAKYCERCGSQLKKGHCPMCDIDSFIQEEERRSNFKPRDLIWFIVLALIISGSALSSKSSPIYNSIQDFIWSNFIPHKKTTSISNKIYKHVQYPLNKEGDSFEVTLSAGNYVVGEDLPEGNYTITNLFGFGSVDVTDRENRIDILQSLTTKEEDSDYFSYYIDNVHLYKGALVVVSTNGMQFSTQNAQTDKMDKRRENPATEEYILEYPTLIGDTIPAGVYDIIAIESSGHVETDFYDGGINQDMSTDPNERYKVTQFKNIKLNKYDKLNFDEGLKLKLVPSEYIKEEL